MGGHYLWNGLFPSRNGTVEACRAVFKAELKSMYILVWILPLVSKVYVTSTRMLQTSNVFHLSTATDQSSTKIQCSHCKLWNQWKHCITTTDKGWQLKPTSNITSQN